MRFARTFLGVVAAATLLTLSIASIATAHIQVDVGTYKVALGWATEPTYSGELNAVQVLVSDAAGNAVTDVGPGDLQVTVGAGGQTSDPLAFEPAFDTEEGFGTPGDYRASIIPTIPGDYTLHLTGTIHGQSVDETATSSETTFSSVTDPADVQFPNKVPAAADLAARIERVDSRVSSASNTAMVVGGAIGVAGIVVGLIALFVALRSRRTARG